MTQLDLFYRAFKNYVMELQQDRETTLLRDAVLRAEDQDKVTVIQTVCTIDEDWVNAIERGIPFIGKAIDEERQFIQSNGEVEPIEKVKHVSRESVEHLARHSNLITREQKGDDILPEKLYTVERLNDYAVYENRFLYLVLCQLRDFISLRYNRIVKSINTYHGALEMRKNVVFGKTKLEYEVRFKEAREDDWYLRNHSVKEVLNRIEIIQRSVFYYLRTPLMVEVAKTDKLKPPITKTNVLRMDKNFKEVVALYEFILSYRKDGYSVSEKRKTLNPLKDFVADELIQPMLLLSFLTYEHGLGLEESLKEEFEKEEERRREEASLQKIEQLTRLKKRLKEEGGSPEQYMLLLERRNQELEQDSRQLQNARKEIKGLESEIEGLHQQIDSLNAELVSREEECEREIKKYDARIEELVQLQAAEAARHADALVQAEREKREEISRIKSETDVLVRESEDRYAQKQEELNLLFADMAALKKEKALLNARLTAMRKEHGFFTETDDYTSEEAFSELENQFEVLGEMVRGEWKSAKQLLRRDFFRSVKNLFTNQSSCQRQEKKTNLKKTKSSQNAQEKEGSLAQEDEPDEERRSE